MKHARTIQVTAALLGVFTLGVLVERLMEGSSATSVLIGSGLLTIALSIIAGMSFLRKSNGQSPAHPLQESESSDLSPIESLPPPESRPIIIGKHLTLEHRNDRKILRLENIGRIQFLEIALALPRGWKNRPGVFPAHGLIRRASFSSLTRIEFLAWILFALSLGVYAITRLFALDQFPINFFSDEANQVVTAMDLAKNGFRDSHGTLFPMYFHLNAFYYPDIAVYTHVFTASLFGKSIVVARATSALMTLLAAGAVGLLLKQVFNARYWWVAVLLLAIMPSWFLFSRTAFDFVAMTWLFALFLWFYLLYRYQSPRYIYLALILGAATFYAYPVGQAAMGLLTIFLLISDFRYHWQQRHLLLPVVLLALFMAIPFIRFGLLFPGEAAYHLTAVNSYWMQDIPLIEKFGRWALISLQMLSPGYWFLPNQPDLIRHALKGYGFMPLIVLPILLLGMAICLRYFNESKYRIVLAALLVVPISAAVSDAAIIRVLAFVMPATIVSALGLEWLLARIKRARDIVVTSLILFGSLAMMSSAMLQDALTNGPTWYSDYTLYGMQWGAKQLFDVIPDYLHRSPNARVYLTPVWANGTEIFPRFFLGDNSRVQTYNIDRFISNYQPIEPEVVFIMIPDELARARASTKFRDISVISTLDYPDGTPGFHFVELEYADDAQAIFAAERQTRQRPVEDQVIVQREIWQVSHSVFGAGQLTDLVDRNAYTLVRFLEANPAMLEITFPSPRTLSSLTMTFGTLDLKLTVSLYSNDPAQPIVYTQSYRQLPPDPTVTIPFNQKPESVSKVRIEILDLKASDTSQIHVREMVFK